MPLSVLCDGEHGREQSAGVLPESHQAGREDLIALPVPTVFGEGVCYPSAYNNTVEIHNYYALID